jgi:hypothetical protein
MRELELLPDAQPLLSELQHVEDEAQRIWQDLERHLSRARAEVEREMEESHRAREMVESLIRNRVRGFDLLAAAWADYEEARAGTLAEHPASEVPSCSEGRRGGAGQGPRASRG